MVRHKSIFYSQEEFVKQKLPPVGTAETRFVDCVFNGCDLSDCSFLGIAFESCQFVNCNLSMAKFVETGFNNVNFNGCKLVGADFSGSREFLFSIDANQSNFDYAIFAKKKNRKHYMSNCSFKNADFSGGDWANTVFANCNLEGATFEAVNLQGTDFTSSYGLTLDPAINHLAKAKFSLNNLPGLLSKYHIIVADI